MEEIWEDVVGYEGVYKVSNIGRVKSLAREARNRHGFRPIRERFLRLCDDGKGYLCVGLRKNNNPKSWSVHRLVAEAFLPNPENLPCVNHINGIKKDNTISNLEWCTYSHNNQHSFDLGLSSKGSRHYKTKLNEEQVLQISSLLDGQKHTQVQIAKMFNVPPQTIYDILKGNC